MDFEAPNWRTASDKAAKTTLESLFHSSIWPNDYGDHASIRASLVEHCLVQLYSAFFIKNALSSPLAEKFYTCIATADCVYNRKWLVHMRRLVSDSANAGRSTAAHASL